MPYRIAFIGTGGRALSHAEAYKPLADLPRRFVAAADINDASLSRFASAYGVEKTYRDYRAMLAEQRPDVVHLTTNPNLRADAVEAAAAHGTKAIIVEKPMSLTLTEAQRIERIAGDTGIKVIVNTQRRYFQSWIDLCALVHGGAAGEILWIRLSMLPALFCAGAHMLDLVQMLLGDPDPVAVWSTAYGAHEYHSSHPAPSSFLTSITYPKRLQLLWEASQDGVGVKGAGNYWMHTEIDLRTTRGFVWWTEDTGWGYQLQGMAEPKVAPTSFMKDDQPGQAAFTRAVFEWLGDPSKPHRNRLETAMKVARIMAAMVQSAVEGRRIDYDPAKLEDRYADLKCELEACEGVHPERQKWDWNRPRE